MKRCQKRFVAGLGVTVTVMGIFLYTSLLVPMVTQRQVSQIPTGVITARVPSKKSEVDRQMLREDVETSEPLSERTEAIIRKVPVGEVMEKSLGKQTEKSGGELKEERMVMMEKEPRVASTANPEDEKLQETPVREIVTQSTTDAMTLTVRPTHPVTERSETNNDEYMKESGQSRSELSIETTKVPIIQPITVIKQKLSANQTTTDESSFPPLARLANVSEAETVKLSPGSGKESAHEASKVAMNESHQRTAQMSSSKVMAGSFHDDTPLKLPEQTVNTSMRKCSQAERHRQLDEFCSHHRDLNHNIEVKERGNIDPPFWNVLLFPPAKMLFTLLPKSGSTTWRSILAAATGKVPPRGPHPNFHNTSTLRDVGVIPLTELPFKEQQRILDVYYKILVVRHPLDRLISAYVDKFQHNFIFKDTLQSLEYMNRTYRAADNPVLIGNHHRRTDVIPEEFIRLVLDDKAPYNKHWTSQVSLSYICNIKYDYIMKLETMEKDAIPIFRRLSKPYNVDLFLRRGNSRRQADMLDYNFVRYIPQLTDMPLDVIRKLELHIQRDLNAFGYTVEHGENRTYFAACRSDHIGCC